jgi:chemotaxis protein MotB
MPMKRRARRRRDASVENHDRWLVTYADLITLLLIFFVILYSISQIDANKYTNLAKYLNQQFEYNEALLEGNRGIVGDLRPDHGEAPPVQGPPEAPQPEGDQMEEVDNAEEIEQSKQKEQALQDLLEVIEAFISEQELEDSIQISDQPEGISITLKDFFLFDLGHANVKPSAEPLLSELSSLFPRLDARISIEGHTDDLPLATGSLYVDNWGLSAARAISVLRYFVEEADLDPKLFNITGYADTAPLAPNNSDENRQKNRRVEIVILRH